MRGKEARESNKEQGGKGRIDRRTDNTKNGGMITRKRDRRGEGVKEGTSRERDFGKTDRQEDSTKNREMRTWRRSRGGEEEEGGKKNRERNRERTDIQVNERRMKRTWR